MGKLTANVLSIEWSRRENYRSVCFPEMAESSESIYSRSKVKNSLASACPVNEAKPCRSATIFTDFHRGKYVISIILRKLLCLDWDGQRIRRFPAAHLSSLSEFWNQTHRASTSTVISDLEPEMKVVKFVHDQLCSQLLPTGTPNISRRRGFVQEHSRFPDRYPNILYEKPEIVLE
jgi:hypothetical protein